MAIALTMTQTTTTTRCVQVAPDAVLLRQVSAGGEDMVLGVTGQGELFVRQGMSSNNPTGTHWQRLKGDVHMVDAYGSMAVTISCCMRLVYAACWPLSQPPKRPLRDSFY